MPSMIKRLTNSITKRLANAYVEMAGVQVGNLGIDSQLRDTQYVSADWDDYFVPKIEKSIYNARLVAEEGYMQGALNNLANKTIINLQLIDRNNELKDLDLKILLEWLEKIDIYQIARDIYLNGMVDGESFIRPKLSFNIFLGKHITPIFLEVNNVDHFMKKVRNSDNEVERYVHYFPNREVVGDNFEELQTVENEYEDLSYEANELLNPMYNIFNGKPMSPVIAAMDDYYHKKRYETLQIEVTHRDNLIIVSSQLDEENQPIIPNIPLDVQDNIAIQFTDEKEDGVVFLEGGLKTTRPSQNKTVEFADKIEHHEKNIMIALETLPSQMGSEVSNVGSLQVIADSETTGWIVKLRNVRTWILKTLNELLERQLLLMGYNRTDVHINFADLNLIKEEKTNTETEYEPIGYIIGRKLESEIERLAKLETQKLESLKIES